MDHRIFSLPLSFRCFSPSRFLEVWEHDETELEERDSPEDSETARLLLLLLEESGL